MQRAIGRTADQSFVTDDIAAMHIDNRLKQGAQLALIDDFMQSAQHLWIAMIGRSCSIVRLYCDNRRNRSPHESITSCEWNHDVYTDDDRSEMMEVLGMIKYIYDNIVICIGTTNGGGVSAVLSLRIKIHLVHP